MTTEPVSGPGDDPEEILRLLHLRAIAYSNPDFDDAARDARENRAGVFVPAEQVPGWPGPTSCS